MTQQKWSFENQNKTISIEFYDTKYGIPNMADIIIYKVKNQLKFYDHKTHSMSN